MTEQLRIVRQNEAEDLELNIVRMDRVEEEEVNWLWEPFIARKKLTALTGEEGIGKSWITCALGAIVSRGGVFPNSKEGRLVDAENVLFLASEDGLGDTLKPRLNSVGADQTRIFAIERHFSLDDVGLLRFYNLVSEIRPALVIIDPFFSYLRGGLNINLSTEIRPVTSRLAEIAEEFDSAFLLVRHVGKSRGLGEARSAGLGSIDFRAVCRSELLVGKNPDDPSEGAIVQIKNNLAEYGEAVGYAIRDGQLYFKATDLTAEKLLSGAKNEEEKFERTEAAEFLREFLREGKRDNRDVKREARNLGISEKMLRTARLKLGVRIIHEGNAFSDRQYYFWQLPESD